MLDNHTLTEAVILTTEPKLVALTKDLCLFLVSKPNEGQRFMAIDDDEGRFDIKASGDYLIASYSRNEESDDRCYKNDQIDEFVAAVEQLHTDYMNASQAW